MLYWQLYDVIWWSWCLWLFLIYTSHFFYMVESLPVKPISQGSFNSTAEITFHCILQTWYISTSISFLLSLSAKHCGQSDIPTCECHNNLIICSMLVMTKWYNWYMIRTCFVFEVLRQITLGSSAAYCLQIYHFKVVLLCVAVLEMNSRLTQARFNAWKQNKTIIWSATYTHILFLSFISSALLFSSLSVLWTWECLQNSSESLSEAICTY